jgi:hypothetical protein
LLDLTTFLLNVTDWTRFLEPKARTIMAAVFPPNFTMIEFMAGDFLPNSAEYTKMPGFRLNGKMGG